MVRSDSTTEIGAADLREILLNLMKVAPTGSAEHANLNSLQQHFKRESERAGAACRNAQPPMSAGEET